MYLKRIEIAGFKSFADRTTIDFENSVTAVVGPNGSGKSNITEAIRWVLGEQSAKSLRGGKMPDIIFAGSDSRKAQNVAEVTVILDNSDHYLPLDYNEISVSRRYRRSGESEFMLNKQNCRLRDIQELFMDSGLGKESFSIISQGKVEAIFSSRPEDRRGIFEEAAGVLKYKQRKKQAEQKLFETEDNLSRVQDIIHELEEQLAPLAVQSETAKEYIKLKEQLTKTDISLTITEISQAKTEWEKQKIQLASCTKEVEQMSEAIKQQEALLIKKRKERADKNQTIDMQQQKLLSQSEKLKQTEGQKDVLFERAKHTQKSTQEYTQSLTELTQKIEAYDQTNQALNADLIKKEVEMQQAQADLIEVQQNLEKYQKSSKELLAELRDKYVDLMQEQATISNELKYLERQYTQETTKNKQTIIKQEQMQAALSALEKQVSQYQTEHKKITADNQANEQAYQTMQNDLKEKQVRLASEQQVMYQWMNQAQQIRARQKSLQDIQDNYFGFYQGVRLVLQHKQQLSGIVGAVAELMDVPEQFTVAIETALGGSAQHIVVENEQDARQSITYLKQQKGGRATFLPLTTIKPRQLPAHVVQEAQRIDGFIGVASQQVSFSNKVQSIVDNLLGTILLAKDLTSANKIAQTIRYQYRVVSLEGDVMNAGGSMTGGANKRGNQGSLFAQNQELKKLTKSYEKAQKALQEKELVVQKLQEEVTDLDEKQEVLRSTVEKNRYTAHELANQLVHVENERERAKKEQQISAFETKELQQFLTDYKNQKQELEKRQTEIESMREKIDTEISSLTQESDKMEERRAIMQQQQAEKQAAIAVLKEQYHHIQIQIRGVRVQKNETTERKNAIEAQLETLTNDSSLTGMTEEELTAAIKKMTLAREQLQHSLKQERINLENIQQTIDQLEGEQTHANQQQKEQLARQTKIEVQKNRIEMRLDQQLNYLQTEYEMTFEKAQTDYPETDDIQISRQQVTELKRQIDWLGPINLNAIEQFEQVNERCAFLISQRDDLLAAKAQLFDTMNEMDEEVKSRFKEVFEGIRDQFKQVFPNMFGGGRAELILTDPNDLLNTGIEIEAQPPGKKLQSLSLLSGGERALTAIALLFSIIQVRPVPFCVLDEVEAALDEANVSRFGHYLSNFQNETQFIVVTHRKGTMESADVLYGVTMQESGVSKIVSVRLEDLSDSETKLLTK